MASEASIEVAESLVEYLDQDPIPASQPSRRSDSESEDSSAHLYKDRATDAAEAAAVANVKSSVSAANGPPSRAAVCAVPAASGAPASTPAVATTSGASNAIRQGDRVIVQMRTKQFNGRTGVVTIILTQKYVVIMDADKEPLQPPPPPPSRPIPPPT